MTRSAAGFALACLVGLLGVGAIVAIERHVDTRHTAAVNRGQSAVSSTLDTRLSRLNLRVDQYAAVLSRSSASEERLRLTAAPSSDFPTFAVAGTALPLVVRAAGAIGDPALIAGAASAEQVRSAAASSRDRAAPVAAVVGSADDRLLVVTWPLYRGAVPPDTASRRTSSAGWVVGAVSVRSVVQPVADVAHVFGDQVTLTSAVGGPGQVDTVLRDAIDLRAGGVPRESQWPVLLIGAVTLVACAALIGMAVLGRRRDESVRTREESMARQVHLISEVSLTMQESLDMGVVLPAVLAQTAEGLHLSSISVVPGSVEGGVEMLSFGRRPVGIPMPRWSPESKAADAGQFIRLPLHRANRTLGHLEIVPSVALDETEFASLRAIAELLGGALYNADLYEREQETVRRLRELDELKDDFLATVSHELRTPLSVLVGFVSLLVKDWDRLSEELRRESLGKMDRHLASLVGLVNDLLDFISERRATSASPEQLALDEQITDLAEQLRPICATQELAVVADGPVSAWTDRRALERIIGNLVGNAAKYSPAGSTIRLAVGAGDDATVSVSDAGPGIRPEDRERIFERFYRGDSDAARATRGTGIGLAVALAWMRAVGARLEITTATGRGTTMTVHFPLTPEQSLEDAGTVVWLDARPRKEELV